MVLKRLSTGIIIYSFRGPFNEQWFTFFKRERIFFSLIMVDLFFSELMQQGFVFFFGKK
jgi:hypothetical protein